MPFAAALSTVRGSLEAGAEVCEGAVGQLGGAPDLAVVFFSAHHAEKAPEMTAVFQKRLAPKVMLGCVAEAVIGPDREVEQQPAMSLWLARWARPVATQPFHLTLERTADGPSLLGWPDALLTGTSEGEAGTLASGESASREPFGPPRSAVLLLGDPYTFPTDLFLQRMNEDVPGTPVLGGMASGISSAGECKLILDSTVRLEGAVGVLLEGEIGLRWIVSQGCRPIGRHMVVTRAQGNVIMELGGRTPLEQMRELWKSLSPQDQELFQHGLHIGRVHNEYQGEFQRGDFLVRNVLGVERQTGALIINDHVRVGQTVQFQVRDADSADEDLRALLQMDLSAHEHRPAGALLFSCNGRGTRLFPVADHDVSAIRQEAGALPLAGFFAQGELGPVGGQNFIHGFTASVAMFEEP
jgi:small ligand-binding sensory domain FIST